MKTRAHLGLWFAVVMLSFAMDGRARAQSTEAALEGIVTDSTGGVLPGVTIQATNEQTGLSRIVVSGAQGSYRVVGLPPGAYLVKVELSGFAPEQRVGQVLPLGSITTLNFTLQLASLHDAVVVTTQAPLVEHAQMSLTTTITPATIAGLPIKGRQFIDLALLAPGVTFDQNSPNTNTDAISFGGFNEQFKSLWIEGIDNNDEATRGGNDRTNASRQTFSQEVVKEFQVLSNQYSVEFGRSGSGVVNMLMKSGTNTPQTSGYYFLRDDAFDKPNAFATGKTPLRRQQFGLTFGGPLQRDRSHLFVSVERLVQVDDVTVDIPAFLLPILPDARSEVPRPWRQFTAFGRVTKVLTPKHYLSVMVNYGKNEKQNQQLGGATAGDGGIHEQEDDVFVTGTVTSAPNSRFTNQLRVSYSDMNKNRIPSGPAAPRVFFPSFTYGQPTNAPLLRGQKNYIVMDTSSYHLERGRSTHDVKAGLEANIAKGPRTINAVFNGEYLFVRDQIPVPGDPETYPARYRVATGVGGGPRDKDVYAFFVEDTWRPRSGLNVFAGLRYDLHFWRGILDGTPIPDGISPEQLWVRFVAGDLQGVNWQAYPNDKRMLAPRVGFAWDATRDGNTVIRGGYGHFYDQIWTFDSGNVILNYPNVFTFQYANDVRLTGIPNTFFPQTPAVSTLSREGSTVVQLPNPTARSPYTQQFSIGGQRQIGEHTSISSDYIHALGLHFYRQYNANARLADGSFPLLADGTVMNVSDYGNRIHSDQVQVKLDRRLAGGASVRAAYTYMRVFAFSEIAVDKTDRNADYGPAPNDIRHRLVLSGTAILPADVHFGGIATAMSTPPYTIITGLDTNHDRDINERPVVNGTMISPFSARGDSYFTIDLRISKMFTIGRSHVEVLWEMYNLLNTKNLGGYQGNLLSTKFGQPRFAFDPFQGQLGFRIAF